MPSTTRDMVGYFGDVGPRDPFVSFDQPAWLTSPETLCQVPGAISLAAPGTADPF